MKKILYIDMDGVLVDFESGLALVDQKTKEQYKGRFDEIPNIFSLMQPVENAIESFNELSNYFDTYILSTAPWENLSAWSDKLEWVKSYLGENAYKRLILTHHKNLNKGHFLVDDREKNGANEFEGKHILFGSKGFEDWSVVKTYLINQK